MSLAEGSAAIGMQTVNNEKLSTQIKNEHGSLSPVPDFMEHTSIERTCLGAVISQALSIGGTRLLQHLLSEQIRHWFKTA